MSGGGIGLVKASKSSSFAEGDVVSGMTPWSTFFIAGAAAQVGGHMCRCASDTRVRYVDLKPLVDSDVGHVHCTHA
jgi:NADPH-dependent curcumin reductase CurA